MNKKRWGEEVYPLLSWFKIDKVKNAKVMVVGGGALGNEVIKNLALFGIGTIVVVDFDTIEYSNLTRSILYRESDADKGKFKAEVLAEKVKEINPEINVIPIVGNLRTDVGLGIYRQMDVVIGCLDSRFARYYLNRLCFRANVPWIDGGIENMGGTVQVYKPNINCHECGLPKNSLTEIEDHFSCATVSAYQQKAGRIATTPILASIIGAIEVQEAMKIIHEEPDTKVPFISLCGKIFHYEGMYNTSDIIKYQNYFEDCLAHEYWNDILEIKELSCHNTIKETLTILKEKLQCKSIEINLLNNYFVENITSRVSNKKFTVMLPDSKLDNYIEENKEMKLLQIAEGLLKNWHRNINKEFPYKNLTLKEIGIPKLDVLKISTNKGCFYVELSGDRL